MMAAKIVPMTKKQLIQCFKPYRESFPDWAVEHGVVLTRRNGPLKQLIVFRALRSGGYRPSHAINILFSVPDGCTILTSHLDVRYQQVMPREHPVKWPLVLRAMQEQFFPSVRKPLDVLEALRLGEEEAERDRIENISYMTGLAMLNAYVEKTERALWWCDRVEEKARHMGRPLGDWEIRKRQYNLALQEAINAGKAHEFLTIK
jgi:hypothetical protein